MTDNITVVEATDPVAAARVALKNAQAAYDKASARYDKLNATIDATEDRLAKGQTSLAGYDDRLDAEGASASAKLILQGAELKIPEPLARKLADRDNLRGEIKILSDGLGSLKESLKQAYSDKRATYTALDDAAAAVLRAAGDTEAARLATILEEARTLGTTPSLIPECEHHTRAS